MMDELDNHAEDLDFASRELCPDGSCLGLLGPDGRCRVCGRARTLAEAHAAEEEQAASPAEELEQGESAYEMQSAADDDGDRELCPDGSCIGLVGPNGHCKVCGRLRM